MIKKKKAIVSCGNTMATTEAYEAVWSGQWKEKNNDCRLYIRAYLVGTCAGWTAGRRGRVTESVCILRVECLKCPRLSKSLLKPDLYCSPPAAPHTHTVLPVFIEIITSQTCVQPSTHAQFLLDYASTHTHSQTHVINDRPRFTLLAHQDAGATQRLFFSPPPHSLLILVLTVVSPTSD